MQFPTPLSVCMLIPQADLPFLLSLISSPVSYYQDSVKIPFLYQDSLFHKLESVLFLSLKVQNVFKFFYGSVILFFMGLHKDKNTD